MGGNGQVEVWRSRKGYQGDEALKRVHISVLFRSFHHDTLLEPPLSPPLHTCKLGNSVKIALIPASSSSKLSDRLISSTLIPPSLPSSFLPAFNAPSNLTRPRSFSWACGIERVRREGEGQGGDRGGRVRVSLLQAQSLPRSAC